MYDNYYFNENVLSVTLPVFPHIYYIVKIPKFYVII